jgi:hypothetical protein
MRVRLLRFLGLGAVLAALFAGPSFTQSSGSGIPCTTNAQCPASLLCCQPCGYYPGCPLVCTQPLNGQCPRVG